MAVDQLDMEFICALLREKAVDVLLGDMLPEDALHKRPDMIFTFVKTYYGNYGELPSPATISAELEIPESTFSAMYAKLEPVDYYIDLLRERRIAKEVIKWEKKISSAATKGHGAKARDLIRDLFDTLIKMDSNIGENPFADYATSGEERWKDFKEVQKTQGGILGLAWPWSILDERTQGMQPGNLIVILASLGVGKSWLLALMASRLFDQYMPGYPKKDENRVVTLFITMEMTRKEIAKRIDAIRSGLGFSALQKGELDFTGCQQYRDMLDELKDDGEGRLFIADAGCVRNVADIEVLASRVDPDVIIVDAFYKLHTHGARDRKREERVSDVVWQMKQLALKRKIPVVASTQYNREVAKKAKKKGYSAGGAEGVGMSYAIMQDADIAIDLYSNKDTGDEGQMYIGLVKNRNNPGNLVFLSEWDLEGMDFEFINEVPLSALYGGGHGGGGGGIDGSYDQGIDPD